MTVTDVESWSRLGRRALEIWRDEGPGNLWHRLLRRTIYRRAVLIQRVIQHASPPPTLRLPVTFDLLSEMDVGAYRRLRSETAPSAVLGRLGAGHLCFVGRHEGRIVNAVWVATARVEIDYLKCDLVLGRDEGYVYESFTSPEARGHNIPAVGVTHMTRHLRDAGYRRLVAIVLPENRPALRHAEKAGWRPIGTIGRVTLGPWSWVFCRVKQDAEPVRVRRTT